jgi:hypothetical protein
VPCAHQVAASVLTSADQIPGGFLLDGRDRDLDDLAQLEQPREMQRVTRIGLDPIAGRPLQLRRRSNQTVDTSLPQKPASPKPVGPAS